MTNRYRRSDKHGDKSTHLSSILEGIEKGSIVTRENLLERCKKNGQKISAKLLRNATEDACKDGLLERIDGKEWYADILTIKEWRKTLSLTTFKHGGASKDGTRSSYTRILERFNTWLYRRIFDVNTYDKNDRLVKMRIGFKNVEEMVSYLEGPAGRIRHVQKVIKTYLYDDMHNHKKAVSMKIEKNAILSYFGYNDFSLNLRFDPKKIYNTEPSEKIMTLSDITRILYCANIQARAVILCMFHRGLDSSTMADRFNYEAFGQIAEYFGTSDHSKWDISKCPVPIHLMRIKTKYKHLGFLEKDAIRALCAYLDGRKAKTGKDMAPGDPLFYSKFRGPITTAVLGNTFEKTATNAGVRVRVGSRYNVSQHEMRDLLKSTLINAGCRYDVADHAIGHKPKDSYEKQAILYPETMRTEYAKAAEAINVLEKHKKIMDGHWQQNALVKKTEALSAEIEYLTSQEKQLGTNAEYKNSQIDSLEKRLRDNHVTNRELQKKIDALQDVIVKLSERRDVDPRLSTNLPLPAMYGLCGNNSAVFTPEKY